jgi:hypothetical protein
VPLTRFTGPCGLAGMLVASAALVLCVAACGAGSGSSGSGGSQGGGNNAFAAYVQCLQRNGVTITMPSDRPRTRPSGAPDQGARPGGLPSGMPRPWGSAGARRGFPGGGMFGKPDDVSQDTWDKAQAACASVRPSRGAGRGYRDDGATAAYRNCLQQHGVTLGRGGLNTTDPTVRKAGQICKVLRPTASATPTA